MIKEPKGKKPRGERQPLNWKDLATVRGEALKRQRPCVRITYAEVRGEVKHSYCFGLEGPDGGFRSMAHISENLLPSALHLLNIANVLSLVLRLRGQDDNVELAQTITKRLEGEATPDTPELKGAMADTALFTAAGIARMDKERKISGSAFVTIADALRAQGKDLPTASSQS